MKEEHITVIAVNLPLPLSGGIPKQPCAKVVVERPHRPRANAGVEVGHGQDLAAGVEADCKAMQGAAGAEVGSQPVPIGVIDVGEAGQRAAVEFPRYSEINIFMPI